LLTELAPRTASPVRIIRKFSGAPYLVFFRLCFQLSAFDKSSFKRVKKTNEEEKMQSPKKTFVSFVAALMLLLMSRAGFGQQWQGNNNTTDPINRTGSVGIGTSTPQGKLDVGNAFYTAAGLITIRGLSGAPSIAYEGGDIRFEGGTDTTTSTTYPSFNLDNYQGHFRFIGSGGTKFFVTNAGRFGIGFGPGIGMPQAQLHLISGGTNPIPFRIRNGTANFTMDVGVSLGMTNLVAGAKVDSIYNPSENPIGYRFLAAGRGASRLKLHDGVIEFYTSSTTNGSVVGDPVTGFDTIRVAINNKGNVGIGLANPLSGYKLSVRCQFSVEFGNPPWQEWSGCECFNFLQQQYSEYRR
jgi:hypothetical protein